MANVFPHEACMFVESDKLKKRVNCTPRGQTIRKNKAKL